ncbi:MAG: seryl-tRNA synthetase [Chloroflexi bacterium]|nr:seryl-tRNA synthetase [Chloroflexota bacterium]
MLSLQFIREHDAVVRKAMADRHAETPLDRLLALDAQRRQILVELESLRGQRNQLSARIGAVKDPVERQKLVDETRSMSARIGELEPQGRGIDLELDQLLLQMPNLPDDSVPVGADAEENVEVRRWGEPATFSFPARAHWEIGETLGIIDFERGARLSGSRFHVLVGQGAALSRALISLMLDMHIREHGHTEISPPFLVKPKIMQGTGQLPKFADDAYFLEKDDLYLIPTAEVPVTNFHGGEILDPGRLPLRYCAYTACFRREAGAAGRDTRGLIRVHQFDKVEMVRFTEPERSLDELETMVVNAEAVLQRIGLPYRVMLLCTGDMGFSARKTYDLEVWMPAQDRYVEISSCSSCGDFQARRADIKFRRAAGEHAEYLHTLNGSGLAVGRTMAALLETYQQEDGTVSVPSSLQSYLGGLENLSPSPSLMRGGE